MPTETELRAALWWLWDYLSETARVDIHLHVPELWAICDANARALDGSADRLRSGALAASVTPRPTREAPE